MRNIFLPKPPLHLPLCSTLCRFLFDQYPAEGSDTVYFGKPNPSQEQCDALDLDICPDLLLAAIAAAGAAALLALYIALTMQMFGRRKKRSSPLIDLKEVGTDVLLAGRFKFSWPVSRNSGSPLTIGSACCPAHSNCLVSKLRLELDQSFCLELIRSKLIESIESTG